MVAGGPRHLAEFIKQRLNDNLEALLDELRKREPARTDASASPDEERQ